MNTEDEIKEVEVVSEKAVSGSETNSVRYDHEEEFDYTLPYQGKRISSSRYERQDCNYIDPRKDKTGDGLPIQQETTGRTLFLRRHVQMMSISTRCSLMLLLNTGESIGLGVFYFIGPMLYESGPVALLLAFVLMGSLCYSVLVKAPTRGF
jgi:amino acid permease